MNTLKPNRFRIVSTFFLCLAVFLTSFAGSPSPFRSSPASATGSLCNYSSWGLVALVQKSNHARQTTWKIVPAGSCQSERVIGVLGSASTNTNALPQMITISGSAIALNSLKANSVPALGLVAIVSPDRSARMVSTREAYALSRKLLNENPNLTKLGYSLGLETAKMNRPVSGGGYGSAKQIGTPPHKGLDAYALDFPAYVGNDRRNPEVMAALNGQVVYSGCTNEYGCATVVRSADINKWGVIYYAVYAHLAKDSLPGLGATVQKGQLLSRMDRPSDWDATHLHFSVRVSSLAYDGAAALYGSGNVYPIDARVFMR
jgi:murein DD-endopeptidase MepM/ murein hydrolase activator NlpD